jgi:hypothetical protein
MYSTEFKIFWQVEFWQYSQDRIEHMKEQVRVEQADYILNVNEGEYIEHLISHTAIDPLVLHFEGMEASSREERISAEQFPFGFSVTPGRSYAKPIITYHLPVTGDLELLHCIPSPRVVMTHLVRLEEGGISFEFIDYYGDADRIKRDADNIIDTLRQQSAYLAKNVADFNSSLRNHADTAFKTRKEQLLKQSNTLANLGIPIRRATRMPQTFAVPAQRKQVAPRPAVASAPPRPPDPALDAAIYNEILQTIDDTGKVFERLPRTYADKDEEALRDHLILQLEPRFEYSTTGETFNKSGKTDILIRHEKKNIFVAECKFWRGEKVHFETIDQILSYLTWRDSKTAIVYFMDTKEMAAPLKAIETSTPNHNCYFRLNSRKTSSWFDYTFHLPSDSGVEIRLTVLCFHLPNPEK